MKLCLCKLSVKAAPPPAIRYPVKAVPTPPPARPQRKISNLPEMMPPPGTHGVSSDVCGAPSGRHAVVTPEEVQRLFSTVDIVSSQTGSAKNAAQDEVSEQVIAKRQKFWRLVRSRSNSRGSSSSDRGSSSSNTSQQGTKYFDEVTKYAEEVTSEEPAQPPPSPPPPKVAHTEPQGFWSVTPFMYQIAVPDAAAVPLPADMDKDRLTRRKLKTI